MHQIKYQLPAPGPHHIYILSPQNRARKLGESIMRQHLATFAGISTIYILHKKQETWPKRIIRSSKPYLYIYTWRIRKSWDFWVCNFEWIYKFNLVQKCSIMRHCGPQLLCCCCAVVASTQLQQTFMKKVFATSASWETLCVGYCLVYVSACCVDICVDTRYCVSGCCVDN